MCEDLALGARRFVCAPIQYSDQTTCDVCGLTWDTNDPAPPPCPLSAGAPRPTVLGSVGMALTVVVVVGSVMIGLSYLAHL